MLIALLYHDIVNARGKKNSGFPDDGSDKYKIDPAIFITHLEAIGSSRFLMPSNCLTLKVISNSDNKIYLTFDDGGISALDTIVPALELKGWLGHFFIPTDFINKPGFISEDHIRMIHGKGHIIGSHSASHPEWISKLKDREITEEWRRSKEKLENIIKAPVEICSVPSGFYSKKVAKAATDAGMKWIFTSDPTTGVKYEEGCNIMGRFTISIHNSPSYVPILLSGDKATMLRESAWWNAKKAYKYAKYHLRSLTD